jgi:hypothetical protein
MVMGLLMRARVWLPAAPLIVGLAACEAAAPTEPAVNQTVSYNNSPKPNLHLVESESWTNGASVSVVITPSGGVVQLAEHQLVVPRSAVTHPTVFTMTLPNGSNLMVDLHAVDKTTGEVVDEFSKPVLLILSYAGLNLSVDEQLKLTVVWLEDDAGNVVPMPSVVNPEAQHVTGWLTHFSQYAMGMN